MRDHGVVDNADMAPFVRGLTDPTGFASTYGYAPTLLGDCHLDGTFNNADIAAFVAKLTGGRAAGVAAPDVASLPQVPLARMFAGEDVLGRSGGKRIAASVM